MTPEQHAAHHALVLASERVTHHPDVYPARRPRGLDSRVVRGETVPGAALAAAVAVVYSSKSTQH